MSTMGRRIKKTMKDRGLTQKQLAELAQISLSYVRAIEQDRVIPSPKTLAKIAKALHTSIKQLERR